MLLHAFEARDAFRSSIVVTSIAVTAAFACATTSTPPPREPGNSCSSQNGAVVAGSYGPMYAADLTCPEGMACKSHWTGKDGMSKPACELLPGRCVSASDCEKKWMECRRDDSGSDRAGFCVAPRM